jgi:hypothetical protein
VQKISKTKYLDIALKLLKVVRILIAPEGFVTKEYSLMKTGINLFRWPRMERR